MLKKYRKGNARNNIHRPQEGIRYKSPNWMSTKHKVKWADYFIRNTKNRIDHNNTGTLKDQQI